MNGSEALAELLSFLGMPCSKCRLPALWKKDATLLCDGCVPRLAGGDVPIEYEPLAHANAVGALRAALRREATSGIAHRTVSGPGQVSKLPVPARLVNATAGQCACGDGASWRIPTDAVLGFVETFYCDKHRPTSGPECAMIKPIRAPKTISGPMATVIPLPVAPEPPAVPATPSERAQVVLEVLRGIDRVRATRRSLTAVEIIRQADGALRAALETLTRVSPGESINGVMLGHMLRRIAQGPEIEGMQLVRDMKVQGFVLWRVKCDRPVEPMPNELTEPALHVLRDVEAGRNYDPDRSSMPASRLVRASRSLIRIVATWGLMSFDGTDASWHLTEAGREQLSKAPSASA